MRLRDLFETADLEAVAREYQYNIYMEEEPPGGPASAYDWRFDPAYPTQKAMAGDPKSFWVSFLADEIHNHDDNGPNGPEGRALTWYRMQQGEKIRDPIVLVEIGGGVFVWDGYHRIGAAVTSNQHAIPAIVGTPK